MFRRLVVLAALAVGVRVSLRVLDVIGAASANVHPMPPDPWWPQQ